MIRLSPEEARRARIVVCAIAECHRHDLADGDGQLNEVDTDRLVAALGWERGDVTRALYDARLNGYITATLTRGRRSNLGNLALKPAGRFIVQALSAVDDGSSTRLDAG